MASDAQPMVLPTWLRLMLGLVGPALIFGIAGAWYLRPVPWTPSKAVEEMDARVAAASPDVAVIGSSWSMRNLDPEALAAALGRPEGAVIPLGQPKSYPAIWYAVARYRLFDKGKKPKVLLLVTGLPALRLVRPVGDTAALEQHFATPDDVLLQKVWGVARSARYTQVMNRRAEPRDALLGAVRTGTVALLHADAPPGREVQDAAAAKVLGDVMGNGNAVAHRFLPVTEEEESDTPASAVEERVEDTFLPDLAALAKANGSRLVVVLSPVSRLIAANNKSTPGVERAFVDYANANDIGWLDLRSMDFDDASWTTDGTHMSPAAAREFSKAVAEKLTAIRAFGDAPVARASLTSVAKVERTGTLPEPQVRAVVATKQECKSRVDLSAWADVSMRGLQRTVGAANPPLLVTTKDGTPIPSVTFGAMNKSPCTLGILIDGAHTVVTAPPEVDVSELRVGVDAALPDPDATVAQTWWVYPGTGIRWAIEGLPDAETELTLAVRSVGAGAAPLVRMGGVDVPLVEGPEGLMARHIVTGAGRPEVEVSAPADGAWIVVRRLTATTDGTETDLVDRPRAQRVDALFEASGPTPPPVPGASFTSRKDGKLQAPLPWAIDPICFPYQLVADGAVIPYAAKGAYTWWLQKTHMMVAPTAAVSPEALSVQLDPARACGKAACATCVAWHWAYPGDTLRASVPRERRLRLVGSLRLAHLRAEPVIAEPESAQVRLLLRMGEETLVETVHPLSALIGGVTETMSRFVPRTDTAPIDVTLTIEGTSAPVKVMVDLVSS